MKKKLLKVLAVVSAAALAVSMVAGCSSNASKSNSNSASDSAASSLPEVFTTLIVGFDNSYPPYGFIGDDGQYTGFDIDLANEVAKRNNWDIQLEPIDWDAKDALLNQGTVNCIWNGFTMEGREDDYTFTKPYMLNEQVIVTKAGSSIKTLADLNNKVVITQIDSAASDLLEGDQEKLAASFKTLDKVSDYNNAFMQLEAGNVDAVACDLSIAAYQMAAKPNAFVQLDEALNKEHYAVGFKKGSTELAEQVTNTLLDMYQDGTVAELCNKYKSYGIDISNWVLTK